MTWDDEGGRVEHGQRQLGHALGPWFVKRSLCRARRCDVGLREGYLGRRAGHHIGSLHLLQVDNPDTLGGLAAQEEVQNNLAPDAAGAAGNDIAAVGFGREVFCPVDRFRPNALIRVLDLRIRPAVWRCMDCPWWRLTHDLV